MSAEREVSRGRATAGIRVGILTLDTRHTLVRGNVQHAASFDFPVTYAVVRDVPLEALMRGDDAALEPITCAVRELERQGVAIIVGACGSFGHYQRAVAASARVPVCLSILVQAPFVLSLLPASQSLGIVFARVSAFTTRVQAECGIVDTRRIVPIGADALAAFAPILDADLALDSTRLEHDLVAMLQAEQVRHAHIGAWLLQCSDLPPYSNAIGRATGLPVFDMVRLVGHLEGAFGVA